MIIFLAFPGGMWYTLVIWCFGGMADTSDLDFERREGKPPGGWRLIR